MVRQMKLIKARAEGKTTNSCHRSRLSSEKRSPVGYKHFRKSAEEFKISNKAGLDEALQ